MNPSRPTALDLAETLFRRLEVISRVLDPTRRGLHDAVRSVGRLAWRVGARSLDAMAFEGRVLIALELPKGQLPTSEATAAKALALAVGMPVRFHPGSALDPPPIERRDDTRRALCRSARFGLARVDSLRSEMAADRDPEAIHQARVSIRRIRAALRVLGQDDEATLEFLRTLSRVSGAVRDVDVSFELVTRLDLAGDVREEAAEMLRAVRTPRLRALQMLLAGDHLAASREALERALGESDAPRSTLRKRGRERFKADLAGLERALRGDLQHAEGFHEIRRRGRRVRDTVDLLGRCLKKKERRWRARLQPLQSHLGSLNDVAVMSGVIALDSAAARSVRDALERRRLTLLAELATPLALLAGELTRERG